MLQMLATLISTHLPAEKEEGQGLVEYALIIVLVSIAVIAGLQAVTGGLDAVFQSISGTLAGGV